MIEKESFRHLILATYRFEFYVRIFRRRCVVIQENGTDCDTVARKINVRGIVHIHQHARTYDGGIIFLFFFIFIFFWCSEHTARVIGTWIYPRAHSQLVARSFIFHVAHAIDHCSLYPVISGNW